MVTPSQSIKECEPHQRRWIWKENNYNVDKNLEDIWLEKLNSLKLFNLINICEGHLEKRSGSRIYLRIKEESFANISDSWNQLRPCLEKIITHIFSSNHIIIDAELKKIIRCNIRGEPNYREDFTIHIDSFSKRQTEQMDNETIKWFEDTIIKIQNMDESVYGLFV